jgi:hypothetical protein
MLLKCQILASILIVYVYISLSNLLKTVITRTLLLLLCLSQFPISNQVVCAVMLWDPALRPRFLGFGVDAFPTNFIELLPLSGNFNDLPEGFVVIFLGYKLRFRIRWIKWRLFIVRHNGELAYTVSYTRY